MLLFLHRMDEQTSPIDLNPKKCYNKTNLYKPQEEENIMAVLKIHGGSDDLVEIAGTVQEEFYVGQGNTWQGKITDPDGGKARVYATYTDEGCWTVALGLWDEEVELPKWDSEIISDFKLCKYSTVLILNVPDGTILEDLTGQEKGRTVEITEK